MTINRVDSYYIHTTAEIILMLRVETFPFMKFIKIVLFFRTHLYKNPARSIVIIWVKFVQTDLMVEIYSKSLVRSIGKVLLMEFS